MKKFFKFFAVALCAVALVSCSSDDSDDSGSSSSSVSAKITVSPSSLSFIATDADAQVVTASSEATVTYEVSDSWVTVTDNGDLTYTVAVANNEDSGFRYATITYTSTNEDGDTKTASVAITQEDESEPFELGSIYYENDEPMGVLYYISEDGTKAIVVSNAAYGDSTATYSGSWNYNDITEDTAAEYSGLYTDVDTGCGELFNAAACYEIIKAHADYAMEVDEADETSYQGFTLHKWAAALGEGWYIPTIMDVVALAEACGVSTLPSVSYDLGSSSANKNWFFEGGTDGTYYDAANFVDAAILDTWGDEDGNILNNLGTTRLWSCNLSYQNTEKGDDGTYTAQMKAWVFRLDEYRSLPLALSSKTPVGRAVKYLYR